MGNVLHVIFRYFIDTHSGVVRVERVLLHKGDANNVLPNAIAYRSVPRYGYCVSCTMPCGVIRDTPVHRCIVPALQSTLKYLTSPQTQQTQTSTRSVLRHPDQSLNVSVAELPANNKVITCLDFERGFRASKGIYIHSTKVSIKGGTRFQHSAYFRGRKSTLEIPALSNTYRYE